MHDGVWDDVFHAKPFGAVPSRPNKQVQHVDPHVRGRGPRHLRHDTIGEVVHGIRSDPLSCPAAVLRGIFGKRPPHSETITCDALGPEPVDLILREGVKVRGDPVGRVDRFRNLARRVREQGRISSADSILARPCALRIGVIWDLVLVAMHVRKRQCGSFGIEHRA